MATSTVTASRLGKLQSYKESSWGGSGAATSKWMGVSPYPEFKPYRKSTIFDEARGTLQPGYLSAILQKGGEWKIPGMLTYEDAVYLGHSFFGIVTASGSASPFTFTYASSGSAQPNLQTYTFEYNQVGGYVLAAGCIANKLSIKGSMPGALTYELSGFAQDIDTAAAGSPAVLADRTVEVAIFPSMAVYMDPSGSAIGSTAYGGCLTDFSLDMENSASPVYTAGSLVPGAFIVGDRFKASLTLSLLYTSAVKTFVTGTLMAGTQALIRLRATSGSKVFNIDYAGVLSDDPALFGDKDGAQLIQIKLDSIYNTGGSLAVAMAVTTTAGSTVT